MSVYSKYDSPSQERKTIIIISLILIVATFSIYGRTAGYDFVNYDDTTFVTDSELVKKGITTDGIKTVFTNPDYLCMQLSFLSHMLDVELFGFNAGRHHLINLTYHVFNVLLLFFLIFRTTGAPWRSFAVAFLFAVHPLNVESVAWMAERRNVLSTFFWFASLLAYCYYAERGGKLYYLTALFLFFCGLLAKSMLVTHPFLLLLLDFWPLKRVSLIEIKNFSFRKKQPHIINRLVIEKTPFFILTAIACVMTFISASNLGETSGIGGIIPLEDIPIGLRCTNALVSYMKYIQKIFFPHNLAIYYPFDYSIPLWQIICAIFFIIAMFFFSYKSLGTRPWFSIGWFWYVGTLVPVIGIVQLGSQSIADRYMYVPAVGIFLIIVWGAADFIKKISTGYIFSLIFSIIYFSSIMLNSWMQVGFWKNSITLFQHAVNVTENSVIAYNNLAIALYGNGKVEEAIRLLEKAIEINPKYITSHVSLGVIFEKLGRISEAIQQHKEVLRIKPNDVYALNSIGLILRKISKPDEAISLFTKAIQIKPNFVEARNNLGLALKESGRYDEAYYHYGKSLTIDPDNAITHNNFALLLKRMGRTKEAIQHFHKALETNPYSAETHFNIGTAFLEIGQKEEAVTHYKTALNIKPDWKEVESYLTILQRGEKDIQKQN